MCQVAGVGEVGTEAGELSLWRLDGCADSAGVWAWTAAPPLGSPFPLGTSHGGAVRRIAWRPQAAAPRAERGAGATSTMTLLTAGDDGVARWWAVDADALAAAGGPW